MPTKTELASALIARATETASIASAMHDADAAVELAGLCDEQHDYGRILEFRGEAYDGSEWRVNLHRAAGG